MQQRMNSNEEFRQLTAFARIDGAIVGALWIASFACFIGEFSMPLLGFVAILSGLASLVVGAMRVRSFRDKVRGGVLTFGRSMLYSTLIYFYASLLMALAQFVYFQFIDGGFLINQYISILSTPEYAQLAKDMYGIEPKEMIEMINTMTAQLRPIDIAFQFLTLNIVLGIVVSLPTALITMRSDNR